MYYEYMSDLRACILKYLGNEALREQVEALQGDEDGEGFADDDDEEGGDFEGDEEEDDVEVDEE